jgi:hypothetical protein
LRWDFRWLIFVNTFDERWLRTGLSRFISRWLALYGDVVIYSGHPLFREILAVNGWNASLSNLFPNAGTTPWVGIPLVTLMVYIPSVVHADHAPAVLQRIVITVTHRRTSSRSSDHEDCRSQLPAVARVWRIGGAWPLICFLHGAGERGRISQVRGSAGACVRPQLDFPLVVFRRSARWRFLAQRSAAGADR